MSKVVVPRVGPDPGPAELALRMEGVAYQARPVMGDYGYGEMLRDLWAEGNGFVLVEHDVVPWPTAVERLAACPEAWCTHAYPSPPGQLHMSIGITKLTAAALEATAAAPALWASAPWGLVDSILIPALHRACALHGHFPPVAHAKDLP